LSRIQSLKYLAVLMLVLFLVTTTIGIAETVEGDLTDRYKNEIIVEDDGVSYRLKRRATFALIICVDKSNTEEFNGYFGILAVDDNDKSISLIELDSNVTTSSEMGSYRLSDAYIMGEDMQGGSLLVLELVNRVLPYAVIDHYIVFNMDGLSVLNEFSDFDIIQFSNATNTKEKLRYAKNYIENLPSEQLSKLFEYMSEYIKSDLKSGAIMKIADKAEKYEKKPTLYFTESAVCDSAAGEYIYLDADELNKMFINVFCEVDPYNNN